MKKLHRVHLNHWILLLAVAMATALDSAHTLASERSSIESTYELTKYLEYQLKEIKDVYLSYLGPPFNDKDFSPPRPNSTALSLPSAATRLELWHGLENQARLAQNQRAYSVLLAAVRDLARSTLCPSLKTSLLHFCTGLDGLLGSISALMTTLGYTLPPSSALGGEGKSGELQVGDRPAPIMSQSLYRSRTKAERNNQRRGGTRAASGVTDRDVAERRRGKSGRRAEAVTAVGRSGGSGEKGRGGRGRRAVPEVRKWASSEVELGETEGWGSRRRLLSIEQSDDGDRKSGVSHPSILDSPQFSYNLHHLHPDTLRKEDGFVLQGGFLVEETPGDFKSTSSFVHRRPPRSLLAPTLPPPLSTLSLLYQFGAGEDHDLFPKPLSLQRSPPILTPPLLTSTTSTLLLSVRPSMNDFARKVEGFWILRELQSWLWRSAKDFNRLKKRLRG
ncbi:uncharacterized protein clcf1 [Synchiropus picturatus]